MKQLSDYLINHRLRERGENYFGDPCELIEQKAFEKLFPTDTVTFDAGSGSFRIEK